MAPKNLSQEQYDQMYASADAGQKATLKSSLSTGAIVIQKPQTAPVSPVETPAATTPAASVSEPAPIDPNLVFKWGESVQKDPAATTDINTPVKPTTTETPAAPVKPDTAVDVTFGADASKKAATNPWYQEARNQQIADSIKAQMQTVANSWVTIDDSIRDKILTNTLSQYGAKVDWNSADWLNTIDNIYGKVTSNQKWQDVYSGINQKSSLINKFSTGQDLVSAISEWGVSTTQLNNIKLYNPELYAKYEKAKEDKMKLDMINIWSWSKSIDDLFWGMLDMAKALWFDTSTSKTLTSEDILKKRDELLSSPEINDAKDKYLAAKNEYQAIQDTYDGIEDDVRAQYEGKGAGNSYIEAIIAKRQKGLQKSLNNAYRNAVMNQENYSLMIGDAKDTFQAYKDSITMQQQSEQLDLQKKSTVLSAIGQMYNIYSQTPEWQKQKMQIEYDFNNPSLNSTDPVERNRAITKSIQEQYSSLLSLGIPFQQSSQQIIAKVQNGVANEGLTPQESIEKYFMSWVREKPQWKALNTMKTDDKTTLQTFEDTDGNKTYAWVNPTTKEITPINFTGNNQTDSKTIVNTTMSLADKITLTAETMAGKVFDTNGSPNAWQCWYFVNQLIGQNVFGNDYADKKALIDPSIKTPQAWDVFVMNTWNQYGHVGFVKSVLDNMGTIEVLQANKNGDGKVTVDTIRAVGQNPDGSFIYSNGRTKIDGFYRPPQTVQSGANGGKDIPSLMKTDKNYEQAANILNGIGSFPSKNDKNYSKVVNAMGDISTWMQDQTDDPQLKMIYGSAKYGKETDTTTLKGITDAFTVLSSVSDLTKQLENQKDDVGPIEWFLRNKNPYDVDAQAIAAQLNALVPKVARGVFGEVGVLTDQDVERYMKTLPNTKMSWDLAKIVSDLLKVTVTKSIINTVVTQAKGQRNMMNFASDYENAKQYLSSKWISSNPWDEYGGSTNSSSTWTILTPQDWLNQFDFSSSSS